MLRVPSSSLRLVAAVSRTTAASRRSVVRYQSSPTNTGSAAPPVPPPSAGAKESLETATTATAATETANAGGVDRTAYLKEANRQMEKYHQTRELFKQGKLKSKNAHLGPKSPTAGQLAVVGFFIAAFLSMPFLGKKIAQDEEFKKKWVPKCMDYTIPKPENPWTRDELHEQMLQIQRDIRERAIAGEFTPEKLEQMQGSLAGLDYNPHRAGIDKSKIPKGWDKIHPGVDDDEDVNEA
jgi:hypothetical protein